MSRGIPPDTPDIALGAKDEEYGNTDYSKAQATDDTESAERNVHVEKKRSGTGCKCNQHQIS